MRALACFVIFWSACGDSKPSTHCLHNDECTVAGQPGICADPDYCASADSTCPSGYRFRDAAGALSGQCVVFPADADMSMPPPPGTDGGASDPPDLSMAAGAADMALHALSWSQQTSGISTNLSGIWGSHSDDVYLVGPYGVLLHTKNRGGTWDQVYNPIDTSKNFYAIWGSSKMDVYVVGFNGVILHSTNGGTSWDPPTSGSGTTQSLFAVWGSGPQDVYAVGPSTVLRSTDAGKTWAPTAGAASLVSIGGVWGSSSTDVYLSAGDGVWHSANHGASWEHVLTGKMLGSIWGTRTSDVWAGGQDGLFHSVDGGKNWTPITSVPWLAGNSLGSRQGIWASDPLNIYLIGGPTGKVNATQSTNGGVSWADVRGSAFPPSSSVTGDGFLTAVWGSANDDVFIVGPNGVVWHGQ